MKNLTYANYPSPLGSLTGFCRNGAITALWLPVKTASAFPPGEAGTTPELTALGIWLERYFRGENPPITFPITPEGTSFQQRVWAMLRTIPYGRSITYGQLAQLLSPSMSSQAIGQAVSRNPIPILIPCHRVLGANNSLTGYSGGIPAKIILLKTEGIPFK